MPLLLWLRSEAARGDKCLPRQLPLWLQLLGSLGLYIFTLLVAICTSFVGACTYCIVFAK
jgi:hypothetical protein